MSKIKIIVVGPCESGKTTLCNFLADATEHSAGEYHPTKGCRILEFEANPPGGNRASVDIEMWDCSGDRKFESCWPAMVRDASGAIFVYNPDKPNHDKDLDNWYAFLVDNQHLKPTQCTVFAHRKLAMSSTSNENEEIELSAKFSKIPVCKTSLDEDQESVRSDFHRFLSTLMKTMSSSREQEELNIINQ